MTQARVLRLETPSASSLDCSSSKSSASRSSAATLCGVVSWLRDQPHDARTWQILALGSLLAWNLTQLTLGASVLDSAVAIVSALAAQTVATKLVGGGVLDLRSPLITGLSLSLLLRGDSLWVPALAASVAIASKFILRLRGKHVFNPAALAIVALLLSGHGWVSPGQWGHSAFLVSAIGFFGVLVLTRASRLDVAVAFLSAHGLFLFARAAWLGDPVAIPLHQLQNGALPLFACFMITDPKTTPDARLARILLAVALAALTHALLFFGQVPPALYISLVLMNLLTPLLDRVCPAAAFRWRR